MNIKLQMKMYLHSFARKRIPPHLKPVWNKREDISLTRRLVFILLI